MNKQASESNIDKENEVENEIVKDRKIKHMILKDLIFCFNETTCEQHPDFIDFKKSLQFKSQREREVLK